MVENWIDEIPKLCEGVIFNGKAVRGFRLFERAEFPGSIDLSNVPCALVFVDPGVHSEASAGGPCIEIWHGTVQFHLTTNANLDQIPKILRAFALIRNAFVAKPDLNKKVSYFHLDEEADPNIQGPVQLKYGSDAWHLGIVAKWVAKEHIESEVASLLT